VFIIAGFSSDTLFLANIYANVSFYETDIFLPLAIRPKSPKSEYKLILSTICNGFKNVSLHKYAF